MNDRDIEDTRQPPDEPEAVFCDDCRQEMELIQTYKIHDETGFYGRCNNAFCPEKHEGVAKEMAELIVYQEEMIEKLEKRIKYFAKKVEALEFHRDEG